MDPGGKFHTPTYCDKFSYFCWPQYYQSELHFDYWRHIWLNETRSKFMQRTGNMRRCSIATAADVTLVQLTASAVEGESGGFGNSYLDWDQNRSDETANRWMTAPKIKIRGCRVYANLVPHCDGSIQPSLAEWELPACFVWFLCQFANLNDSATLCRGGYKCQMFGSLNKVSIMQCAFSQCGVHVLGAMSAGGCHAQTHKRTISDM